MAVINPPESELAKRTSVHCDVSFQKSGRAYLRMSIVSIKCGSLSKLFKRLSVVLHILKPHQKAWNSLNNIAKINIGAKEQR